MEVVKERNKEDDSVRAPNQAPNVSGGSASAHFRTRASFQIEDGKKLRNLSSGDKQTLGESNREKKSKISSGRGDELMRKWRGATRTTSVSIMQDCKYESPPSIGGDSCNKDD